MMSKVGPLSSDGPRLLGPASAFQIEGRLLRFGLHEDEVAVYRDGKWTCQGCTFRVLECEVPIVVRFEDEHVWRPSVHGPFATLQISGGTICHGPNFKSVLARFDEEAGNWLVCPEGEAYSTIVLARPPRPTPRATRQVESASRVLYRPKLGCPVQSCAGKGGDLAQGCNSPSRPLS